ncbi:MAG: four helix bundle protein [Chloroflexi bacterium]|nr:four helix bundle protein [Chloroflexota bacterium]
MGNPKSQTKPYEPNPKSKTLRSRSATFKFAKDVIGLSRILPKALANVEVARQVVRSAGSVGANYIEANEALSKKDFAMRAKLCRKEAKETRYWLGLLEPGSEGVESSVKVLIAEANELTKIFSAIVEKTK